MEVSAASEADEAAEVIEVAEDFNGSEIIQCVKKMKMLVFGGIEAGEFIMVYMISEASEGLTRHLDNYIRNW